MQKHLLILLLLIFLVLTKGLFALQKTSLQEIPEIDSLVSLEERQKIDRAKKTLSLYNRVIVNGHKDSITLLKRSALLHAELGHANESVEFTQRYINNTTDIEILHNDSFKKISTSAQFITLKNKYLPKVDLLNYLYLFIAIIGFYITIALNFNKSSDRIANLLISSFVGIHVLFILEFILYSTNLQYKIPHTYAMASFSTLLYGPILYFYFKRITQQYKFRKIDLLHLLPTVIVVLYLLPIYSLDSSEKIEIMMGISKSYNNYTFLIFFPKLASLIIYGYFILKVHLKYLNSNSINHNINRLNWEKNIYRIHVVFLVAYFIYGFSISGIFGEFPSYIYNAQVAAMSVMVIYVAYMANAQPKVFTKEVELLSTEILNKPKYVKSGLTSDLSKELSQDLIKLLVEDKVYRDSNICLESLSQKLNTSRHNTSQIINEHFNINFFELINKFRIEEAINILNKDIHRNLNIIDVAYEVGYNNKVTFNKAFKKETSLTPSQFLETTRQNYSRKLSVSLNRQGKLL